MAYTSDTKARSTFWWGLALAAVLGCSGVAGHRVLVWPFDNLSQVTEDNWLRDGFSESLDDHYAQIHQFQIVPRHELNQACAELKTPLYRPLEDNEGALTIARHVGATEVIVGSFRRRDEEL